MPFDGTESPSFGHLEKLDRAIDLLSLRGQWCKGAERNPRGQYCLRGALVAVGGWEMLRPALAEAVREVGGSQFRRIEEFNDHPLTTHEDIVNVLKRAREHVLAGKFIGTPAINYGLQRPTLRGRISGFWHRIVG